MSVPTYEVVPVGQQHHQLGAANNNDAAQREGSMERAGSAAGDDHVKGSGGTVEAGRKRAKDAGLPSKTFTSCFLCCCCCMSKQ